MSVKVMISQPMAGKTSEEISAEREHMSRLLNEQYDGDFIILDTTVPDYDKKSGLECFSESIGFMSQADVLVMGIGWENARGCLLEHEIAKQYNKKIMYLDTNPFLVGITEYTRPSCHDCPAIQAGDICDLQYANKVIQYANKVIDSERVKIKKLKKDCECILDELEELFE